MNLKLQLLPDGQTWGVYVKPDADANISGSTITIGGNQITIVMPKNYVYWDFENVNGNWNSNAVVNGPAENPTKSYVSFGFASEAPPIPYVAGQETLLFKFKTSSDCPNTMYLIDNATDPFSHLPNSINSNPGIELAVYDFLTGNSFSYKGTYATAAWDCKDNDNDGIKNALEDTNGNGVFDPGVDVSDLNNSDAASTSADIRLKLQLMPDGQTWGVYVKPDDAISMSNQTITGLAQVTVLMPKDYEWTGLQSVSGTWVTNATINGAAFNPTKKYVTFGLMNDFPHINYVAGNETLLFSFKMQSDCPDDLYLIDNLTDPIYLNCDVCNPGTEFSIFDPINPNLYSVTGNYAPAAWDCHDNDGDGVLNALEDSNGNGVFDAGVDASDLNNTDLASSNGGIKFKLQLMPDGENWGVYAKPEADIFPSENTITGTAQVTLVMPKDYAWSSLQNVGGNWSVGSVANGPVEHPDKQFVSFGLTNDLPHITYHNGEETLLFTLKKSPDCPQNLHLIDMAIDSFMAPNSMNTNPGNDIAVIDISTADFQFFTYAGIYAPSAWDCHDNDGDGIANALEDTNGNGIFDAGVDASDLNTANPTLGTGCVLLKLQMLPDSTGWGVFAKPSNGYQPSANAVATGGQVTIVAPESFDFAGLESTVGQWSLTSTLHAQPNSPNRKYLTIELASNAANIDLGTPGGTMLFKFDKLGDCPESLAILENNIPASLTANEFSGTDPNSFTSSGFEYCGVYARKNWRCKAAAPHGPVIFVGTDSLAAPQTGAADRGTDGGNLAEAQRFTLAPNPAGDFVNILVSANLAEGQKTLALWDLQGRKHQEILLENMATKLDLSDLPAGVYFVSLAQNGRVVERKKLIVR